MARMPSTGCLLFTDGQSLVRRQPSALWKADRWPAGALAATNAAVSVCLMIESKAGLDIAGDLAAVPGVDYLSFGMLDLADQRGDEFHDPRTDFGAVHDKAGNDEQRQCRKMYPPVPRCAFITTARRVGPPAAAALRAASKITLPRQTQRTCTMQTEETTGAKTLAPCVS